MAQKVGREKVNGAVPPPERPRTILITKSVLHSVVHWQHRFWNNFGRIHPPPLLTFRMSAQYEHLNAKKEEVKQKLCQKNRGPEKIRGAGA